MKILIVTDAWRPQVNGVVRTLEATVRELQQLGHRVQVIAPAEFPTVPCPGYAEIRLALASRRALAARIAAALAGEPLYALHVSTEGPLGWAARRFCLRHGLPFTTAYHTRFPQYLNAMFGVPQRWVAYALGRFHRPAARVLSATPEVDRELAALGVTRVARWTRGVDLQLFRPDLPPSPLVADAPRPRFLYAGRVAVEKNIEAFLSLDLPGSRIVAGDGPLAPALRRRYPTALFVGRLDSAALARLYASVDVLVFPSRTDTFGLVQIEALACGTPVAAYPVPGPRDVLGGSDVACLQEDLRAAALQALAIPRARCRAYAERFSWRAATAQFVAALAPVEAGRAAAAGG
ncbi:MAG: glycosyltransferase family 1 protein [Sutterellaceae bacterium]|nr:glycosyltransferase family 1 protein [Burkholderiaceae bacterium]MCX7901209.1 glycosyltransferase family 1 protein [Burkholderiaceae bacterium]MDW8430685.1 glycosyltransferase family 1 protein [Sutterellaceae bacterium]